MSAYTAQIEWRRDPLAPFTDNRYSRAHQLRFDGGIEVPGSSSPSVVPLPMSSAGAVDPEEMFVAALASCHMLWFLSIAAQRGWRVDHYVDDAGGTLARDGQGRLAMTEVLLRPLVRFGGDRLPTAPEQHAMHHAAHQACFIASSVKSDVRCEPRGLEPDTP